MADTVPETPAAHPSASRGGATLGTAHVFHIALTSALLVVSTVLLVGGWYLFGMVILAAAVATTFVNFSGE